MLRHGLMLVLLLAPTALAQVPAAWLGVYLADVEAAEIAEVVPGSPAAAAGLRAGDVVHRIGDRVVGSAEDLIVALAGYRAGDRVVLRISRGDRDLDVEVRLATPPEVARAEPMPRVERTGGAPPAAPGGAGPRLDPYERARIRAIERGVPLVVVFFADWCPHSEAQLRALAAPELADARAMVELVFVDTDVDDLRADAFGVARLPHLVVLSVDGETQARREGYQDSAALRALIHGLAPAKLRVSSAGDTGEIATLRREIRAMQREIDELRAELRALRSELERVRRRR